MICLHAVLSTQPILQFKGKHQEIAKASSSTRTLASYYKPQLPQNVIEAETRWAMFVSKHNIAFLTSDHATKLFAKMFPDSEVARFACGRTKTTAIIKEALAPHFLQKTKQNMASHFSIMMDESNDKTDKSCIILVRVFYSELGDTCTRFLDMPIVNIGTAQIFLTHSNYRFQRMVWTSRRQWLSCQIQPMS